MTREIRIEEGKLKVVFEIQENGVVELKQFDPAGRMDVKERDRGEEDFYPITEVQITGRGTRGMHAYKHNVSGGATDFVYQSHEVLENEKGKELVIHTATEYGEQFRYGQLLKMKEQKRLVWNMYLPLYIRDSARVGKSLILRKQISIHRITVGIVRVSGERMTVGRSI